MKSDREINLVAVRDNLENGRHPSDSELIVRFLEAIDTLPSSAVARVCGLDGQTIQNMRHKRIKRIRRNTRERIIRYLDRGPATYVQDQSVR